MDGATFIKRFREETFDEADPPLWSDGLILRYFDEAQTYLRCLDAARAEVSEEINRAIRDYQALGPEPDG